MQVSLSFDVDGGTWKAVRAVRRNGSASHVLYRVEDDGDVEVADKAREMSERIEALLGLDFDGFRRSVLLAQNQFATFLEATGTQRNQVLKGVFGFERLDSMRSVAKDRLDGIERSLATLAGRRASATADEAEAATKRTALAAAEERERALEELRTPFEETKEIIATSAAQVADADARLQRLVDLSARIPDAARIAEVVEAAERGDAALVAARTRLEEAAAARVAAAAARDAVLAGVGGRSGLDAAADLVSRWRAARDRRTEASSTIAARERSDAAAASRLAEAETALERAMASERDAATARDAAAAAVEAAQRELVAAQDHERAHVLRGRLTVGEPCPVCEHPVSRIPTAPPPSALASAEMELERTRQALAGASGAAEAAAASTAAARSDVAAATEARSAAAASLAEAASAADTVTAEVARLADEVRQRLGPGDPGEALAELRRRLESAEGDTTAATAAEEEARKALTELEAETGRAADELAAIRTEIAVAAAGLDISVDAGETPGQLAAAAVALREAWIGRNQAAEGDRATSVAAREAAEAALADLLEAAGLGAGDDVVEVIGAARSERAAIEAEVQLLEKRIADLERLAQDEAALVASAELLGTLHADLAPSRFLEFVLDERRRALGDLASEHLDVLTSGRYRFDESGEFLLVDRTAADSVRSPASLSGGETFLASLALALALAEIVSREGGRLDAFFLDEGFGSLDPEHLDLAMDGIERLVTSGDRLVVVVSHVPALQQRIEDLIVLDRDPASGNTVVMHGSGR
jgi:exonuclease SbcC